MATLTVDHAPAKTAQRTAQGNLQRRCACGQHIAAPGPCETCRQSQQVLQRQAANQATPGEVPPIVHETLRAQGQPLAPSTRAFMETHFNHDFSQVRVHIGAQAGESARAVNALAYTVGNQIVFGAGRYQPQTPEGGHLVAHELAHVVQQAHNSSPANLQAAPEIGSSHDQAEREAQLAAQKIMSGQTHTQPPRHLVQNRPILRRAEYGTYVSTLGDRDYLEAGFQYYRTWGFPNVKRVSSMDDVLKDLDRAKGTIEKFRIVSHGSSIGLELGLLPELSPDYFYEESATFTNEQKFREQFTGTKLVSESFFVRILDALRKDATTAPLLTTIGVGAGTPGKNTALGIVLRAMVDARFLADVRLDTGGAPAIPNRDKLEQYNELRIRTYQPLVVKEAPKDNRAKITKAFAALATALPAAMSAAGLKFGTLTAGEATSLADPVVESAGGRTRLKPELTKSIKEGAGGPFLKRLQSVQGKIDKNTHVEIRGCNVGRTVSLLDKLRAFFGRAGNLPSISAPDLFQYFFRLSFRTFGKAASEETALEATYRDPDTGLAKGYEDTKRLLSGEMTRVVDEKTLGELSAKYGYNAKRLRQLNPEISDPDKLARGQIVWLRQRKQVHAGYFKTLGAFCREYLGNEYAWPKVWAANPAIKDPKALKPGDLLDVPVGVLTPPIVSDAPTFGEVRTQIRGGKAVVGIADTAAGPRPTAYLDASKQASALGEWLAAQKFDPKGRTAAVLSQRYRKNFRAAIGSTYVNFLSLTYPNVEDPIFPEDPRYDKHFIKRP